MAAAVAAGKAKTPLDPLIWKACAGKFVRIPPVGSLVYYFPQGHAEQAALSPNFSTASGDSSFFLCRLVDVCFLADADTDEVFATLRLNPRISLPLPLPNVSWGKNGAENDSDVVSFAKVLTPSDANNGGGFSVPRFCADSIFPPLNYKNDPPLQTLFIRDVHGVKWEFRHIYRGTPKRHLLTTGWSKFVNSKKLVAGDSVVFVRNRSGELFVGVRRTARSGGHLDFSHFTVQPHLKLGGDLSMVEGFSRNCIGRVTPEAVVEAAKLASMERSFEVEYFPRVGSADFVVRKEEVEAALALPWSVGARVKMAVESEDSSRMTSYPGTLSCIVQHPTPFSYSSWRALEVTWDEPDSIQNARRVSPWELGLVSASPQILPPYLPMKKARITDNQEISTAGAKQNAFLPVSRFSTVKMESINPLMFSHDIFPAGMQGARHDPICVSSLSNFLKYDLKQTHTEKMSSNEVPPKTSHVSTELIIGCEPQSKSLSPLNQNSVYCYGSNFFANSDATETSNVTNGSFQLFGTTIHIGHPVVADAEETCSSNIDPSRPADISLTFSQNKFHDEHDCSFRTFPVVKI